MKHKTLRESLSFVIVNNFVHSLVPPSPSVESLLVVKDRSCQFLHQPGASTSVRVSEDRLWVEFLTFCFLH